MKKSLFHIASLLLVLSFALTSCEFEKDEPQKPNSSQGSNNSGDSNQGSNNQGSNNSGDSNQGQGSNNQGSNNSGESIPDNNNIFTANGTPYYYGKYIPRKGWSIGTCTINADYGYYIFDVEGYSVQLTPAQLKEYNEGTLYNVNSVALRIALEEFNPLTAKVGDLLKLRIVDDVYDNSGLNSRFYFFYNNAKNQIRYTFTDTLKGEISFLGYDNNIITLNLKNVHVYRTGTAPEDAPLEFVMNGIIEYQL